MTLVEIKEGWTTTYVNLDNVTDIRLVPSGVTVDDFEAQVDTLEFWHGSYLLGRIPGGLDKINGLDAVILNLKS